MKRKPLTLCFAILLSIGILSGCTNIFNFSTDTNTATIKQATKEKKDNKETVKPLTFDEIYTNVNENIKKNNSYQLLGDIDGKQGKSSINGMFINNPQSPEFDMTSKSDKGIIRIIVSNGFLYQQDSLSQNKWNKLKLDDKTMQQLASVNYNYIIDLITIGENPKVTENQQEYILSINKIDKNKLLDYVTQKNNALGLKTEQKEQIRKFFDLDKINMKLYINKNTFNVNKAVGEINVNIAKNSDDTLSNFSFDLNYSKYNENDKLQIPYDEIK